MPTHHQELLERYAEDLAEAKVLAESWWDQLLDIESTRLGDREEAIGALKKRWPLGPSSHPRVIAVIREYYLACVALNDQIESGELPPREADEDEAEEDEEEVYPDVFTTEWLLEPGYEDLGAFIAGLSYWPIGLDEDFEPV